MIKNGVDSKTISGALSLREHQVQKFIELDKQPTRIKFLKEFEQKH